MTESDKYLTVRALGWECWLEVETVRKKRKKRKKAASRAQNRPVVA